MNRIAALTSLIASISAAGCATPQFKDDAICSEIALFANTVHGSDLRQVTLTNDWGGKFLPKQAGTDVIAAKRCDASDYSPGEAFCGYLITDTSTEFPEINLNRVLSCFGAIGPNSNKTIEYGPTKVWSYASLGVKATVRVGIEYLPESESAPSSLKILAEGMSEP